MRHCVIYIHSNYYQNMSSPSKCHNFLILGHSFTRRLQSWCVEHKLGNLNLDCSRIQIFWHGIGGATITGRKSLWDDVSLVSDLDIDAVFIDIGTNDLCNFRISPKDLADRMISFAEHLISHGCKIVVFSEILHRRDSNHFNNKVDSTNTLLKTRCLSHPKLRFWSHSRNRYNRRFTQEYVAPDGVHVDAERGMPRYYASVWGACLQAERFL